RKHGVHSSSIIHTREALLPLCLLAQLPKNGTNCSRSSCLYVSCHDSISCQRFSTPDTGQTSQTSQTSQTGATITLTDEQARHIIHPLGGSPRTGYSPLIAAVHTGRLSARLNADEPACASIPPGLPPLHGLR